MDLGKKTFSEKAADFFHSKWFKLIIGIGLIVALPTVYANYKITHATFHLIASGMCLLGGVFGIYSAFNQWKKDQGKTKLSI